MIDFYAAKTPNARKIAIMLEECDARFQTHMVDIGKGEQLRPEFLRVNPNAKIPAIVDQDSSTPVKVFESAAILIYLGEKSGRLLPTSGAARAACISWTVWQAANVGPMFGQANHFANVTTEKCPYAIERFSKEAARLVQVMEVRLGEEAYLAGAYSIADIAVYPWIRVALDPMARARSELIGETPNIRRWFAEIGARPAVQRGIAFAT